MSKALLNPFIYGKPVSTGRFVGRQEQVRVLFSRLFNGESTAIVGEPHMGKTSLLRYIADEDTRREWIAQIFGQHVFVDLDCHLMPIDFGPSQLWAQVLEYIKAFSSDAALHEQCDLVITNQYGSLTLERLFKLLDKREWRVVLMIDEFDVLLGHPTFGTAEFLGALRSFATRTNGLVVITASRLSVAQMNRLSMRNNPYGSPFFNNMTEVRLPSLDPQEAEHLIDMTLHKTGNAIAFTSDDRQLIYTLAGRQPFLLQVAAASLYDALTALADKKIRGHGPIDLSAAHERAKTLFAERSAAHFEDLTRTLEANSSDKIEERDQIDRQMLRQNLEVSFNLDELQALCFDIGVDYEDIGGDGQSTKALKLILYCQRRGLIVELLRRCQELRPKVMW